MKDSEIEKIVQEKGLTKGPRVTPDELNANIVDTEIVKHVSKSGKILRWAVITTQSGHAVHGRANVALSAENDNEELGKQLAIENAKSELWALMAYEKAERLHREANAA